VAVNDSGLIVGNSTTPGGAFRAVLWTPAGQIVTLDTLGGSTSLAQAVNASGQIVGTSNTTGNAEQHGAFWTPTGEVAELGTLGGTVSFVATVNDSGLSVGNSNTFGDAAQHAVLWWRYGAQFWVGLKNSDDQGTQFALRVEVLRNGALVASGLQRCVTGVTRDPSRARTVGVKFDAPLTLSSGDALALRVSTRIGTTATGTKCSGPGGSHSSAAGLRLYYDSASRPSRFDAIAGPNQQLYFDSDGSVCGRVPESRR
jgi:probable HAF family extracellular repeat protein